MKVAEGVPPHFAELLQASEDLDTILEGHVDFLFRISEREDSANDKETVFLRAGIVLLCSAWEAYVEQLARNTLSFLLENSSSPSELPKEIRKGVAKDIRDDKDESSPWKLAGEGWRKVVSQRFEEKLLRGLNTPSSLKVKSLYELACGIQDITESWTWEGWEAESVRQLIADFVAMRGDFAHGRKHKTTIPTPWFIYLRAIVFECAIRMNNFIVDDLQKTSGKMPWAILRSETEWEKFRVTLGTIKSV